ncbi:murein biosynthesis integral membrane protein MurJ [Clostridium perfringens]|uniref:murein biosynthesis integral membrane protein MurJ n=1 Tax=Clostridium perfringens TaxID=1502 RepID=UPI001CCD365A|nr:murein biosynthesis integral membrane protein MurJ [Clostridium perfringens]EHK2328211.1 murein biosynthesis integral membrane protein MurJ [Clostridium perfringens]MDM0477850.1 murein biosynthesis integral membrane protein MurJ [Clostridium perfringens]MDM0486159.1 murein biosynthesis integral membrane protein MurJ [Clostridium perfringens]UBK29536.1 murein biosynthesis integral membrane protein MurJ [Clostridium perfringens]
MNKKSLIGTGVIILLINIFGKFVNFFKEILLANKFGTNVEISAYIMAITVPVVVTGILASAINNTLIPILTEIKENENKNSMFSFFNLIIIILLMIIVPMTVLMIINPNIFIHIIAPGFKGKTLILTSELLRISAINTLLITVIYAYLALLNVEGIYTITALINFVLNIPMILYLLMFNNINIKGISISNVLGVVLQFLLVMIYLKKIHYIKKVDYKKNNRHLKELINLSSQAFLINGVYQINTMVDRMQASKLIEGSVAALEYSNKVINIAMGLVTTAILTIIYPILAKVSLKDDKNEFFNYIYKSIDLVLFVMIPFSIGLMFFNKQLISIFYGRGEFDKNAIIMTANILIFASIGVPFISIKEILFRVFYSIKAHKKATINSVIGVSVNIILNIILSNIMGAEGLAFATSIAAIVTTLLLIIQFKNIYKDFNIRYMLISFLQILSVSIISISTGYIFFMNTFIMNMFFNLLFSILLSIIIYFITMLFVWRKKFNQVLKIIKKNS